MHTFSRVNLLSMLFCCVFSLCVERLYAAPLPTSRKAQVTKPARPKASTSYFWISRKVLQDWLQHPMAHATSVRVIPTSGKHGGLKLVWVQKRSLYAYFGLLTGDVVISVNGKRLNITNALALSSQLSHAKKFVVVLLRKGEARTHVFYVKKSTPAHKVMAVPPPRSSLPSQEATKKAPSKRKRDATSRKSRAQKPLASYFRQVKAFKKDHYTFPKALVGAFINRLDVVASHASIIPYFKGGKCIGFRLTHIKKGSLYARIGIKDRDIITTINGLTFTSPQKALDAYYYLQRASVLRIRILRRKEMKTIVLAHSVRAYRQAQLAAASRPTTRRAMPRKPASR